MEGLRRTVGFSVSSLAARDIMSKPYAGTQWMASGLKCIASSQIKTSCGQLSWGRAQSPNVFLSGLTCQASGGRLHHEALHEAAQGRVSAGRHQRSTVPTVVVDGLLHGLVAAGKHRITTSAERGRGLSSNSHQDCSGFERYYEEYFRLLK